MNRLHIHMEELGKLMEAKGYGGHFLSNSAHPDKLMASLQAHLAETFQKQAIIQPFYLTTYAHWKDEERPYVKCDFRMKYDSSLGFQIDKMEVTRANHFGTIKSIELKPTKNKDIPNRDNVNRLVGQKKKSLKI